MLELIPTKHCAILYIVLSVGGIYINSRAFAIFIYLGELMREKNIYKITCCSATDKHKIYNNSKPQ